MPLALTASMILGATLEASKLGGTWQFLTSHQAQTLTFRDSSSASAEEEEDDDDSHSSSVRVE